MTSSPKRIRAAKAPSLSNIERSLGPIIHLPIDALRRYPGNPRRHPEKQLVKLAASIAEFGFTIPVLIDADHMIIAGEARVEAAKHVGMLSIPVLVAANWSTAQVRAYRLVPVVVAVCGLIIAYAVAKGIAARRKRALRLLAFVVGSRRPRFQQADRQRLDRREDQR